MECSSWFLSFHLYFYVFILWNWDLNSEFVLAGYFGDGILRTICLDGPQTMILLISQIAGINRHEPQVPDLLSLLYVISCLWERIVCHLEGAVSGKRSG
jgi:hypothetical protein